MRYYVELEGQEYEVEVGTEGVELDGSRVDADLRRIGPGLWHLLMDGRSHTFSARRSEGRGLWDLGIGGYRMNAVVMDERRRAIRRLTGIAAASTGPIEVEAPMPGLVIAVEVSEGDVVVEGQGLAVIEAMKMENELKAKRAGRVKEIRVGAGQAVDKGDTLMVVAPEAAESEG